MSPIANGTAVAESQSSPMTAAEARAFEHIAGIVREEAGLALAPEKAPMVFSRLAKRLRRLGLSTPAEYCALLDGPDGAGELPELISTLTTNVTSFFREAHHFRALREDILPDLLARARRGERVRLWSAGCSTGQEAASIAIEILEQCPEAGSLDIRILATDIDRRVLEEARAGVYPAAQVAAIPAALRARHFAPAEEPETYRISDSIRALVSVRPLNLIKPWPFRGPFHAIFCRNVIIYFGPDTQRTLLAGFARLLVPGGHIFLGHSERIERPAELGLGPAGTTTYRKTGPVR